MSDDVAKLADKLNENMAHAVMNAFKGGINCDVPTATQKAIAKRGLATWDAYNGADLTPLGLQVQEYLKAKKEADTVVLAAKLAADRAHYDEGYAAGQSQMLAHCVAHLLQAVYPGDSKPDRPNDTIFNTLIAEIPKYLEGRRVTAEQVHRVTQRFHDATKSTVFYEQPWADQQWLTEAMRKAMVDAGIRVVSASDVEVSVVADGPWEELARQIQATGLGLAAKVDAFIADIARLRRTGSQDAAQPPTSEASPHE